MPIYEFYCQQCHTLFNFFSRRINTAAHPPCPRCGKTLKKQLSTFSAIGRAQEPESGGLPAGLDEAKLEQAFGELASQAEGLSEDNPRQMAQFLRALSAKAGVPMGQGMEEALARLEAGEDPERIEQEMGAVLEDEAQLFGEAKKAAKKGGQRPPYRDETLYELE
ncbi:MAG TPA: zinc ribbon domain-containing protein [Desulfurivibrionaceae bacterium]|nr:zinc ribbon domain-containing protein [Desulfurivibrionaceae bacterium]